MAEGKEHRSCSQTCDKLKKHLGDPFVTLVWSCLTVVSWVATFLIVCAFYDDFDEGYAFWIGLHAIIYTICGIFGIVATAKCTRWWPGAWVFMVYCYMAILFIVFIFYLVIACKKPPAKSDCEDGTGKWDKEKCNDMTKCHEFSLLFQNEEGKLLFLFWALFTWAIIIMLIITMCATFYFLYELKRRKANGLKACCGSAKKKDDASDDEAVETEEEETEGEGGESTGA